MSASSSASRPRVESVWSLPAGDACSTSANHSVTSRSISSAASWVAERVRLGWRAAGGAFEHAQHQLAEQDLVADAQRVEIIFHFFIRRIPFFQRAPRQMAVGIGQCADAVHGGLHW